MNIFILCTIGAILGLLANGIRGGKLTNTFGLTDETMPEKGVALTIIGLMTGTMAGLSPETLVSVDQFNMNQISLAMDWGLFWEKGFFTAMGYWIGSSFAWEPYIDYMARRPEMAEGRHGMRFIDRLLLQLPNPESPFAGFLGMTLRGLAFAAPVALALNSLFPMIAGLLMGVVYFPGLYWREKFKAIPVLGRWIGGRSLGEWLFGALLGITIPLALFA